MNLLLNELILESNNMSTKSNEDKNTSRKTTVIQEVYDGVNSTAKFEYELECALEAKTDYIVIEPTKLGKNFFCLLL